MEHFNSESHFSDEESDDNSSGNRPVRHVAVPATALHGVVGVGRETPKAPEPMPAPRLKDVFSGEHHRRQQEAEHFAAEQAEDDEDDDEEAEAASTNAGAVPRTDTPVQPRHTAEHPANQAIETSEEAQTTPPETETAELSQEAIDKEFSEIVEINLHDIDVPMDEREPQALDMPVAEVIEQQAPYEAAREAQPAPANFAPWEAHAASEPPAEPEFPSQSGELPLPAQPESGNMAPPDAEESSEPPAANNGNNNQPPTPPTGPSMEAAGSSPEPEPGAASTANYARMRPNISPNFAQSYANSPMSPAERLYIDTKLQYAEAARQRGDMITGLVAGWALVRTFRNRKMIKRNAKETKQQFTKQEQAITNLAQQNTLLQQRASRGEQQTRQQQAAPNRFRPAGEAMPGQPSVTAAEATAVTAAAAAEKVRLVHEQQENALRRQTLEVPPDHEVVRSQWHSIEIDKKTGMAVEQPTGFEYGEAFQQERRREQLQDALQDANTPQQIAAAPAAAAAQQAYYYGPQQPPVSLPGTAQQAVPAGKSSQKALAKTTGKQITSAAANPWFWAAIIFLLIVFFTAAWF